MLLPNGSGGEICLKSTMSQKVLNDTLRSSDANVLFPVLKQYNFT